MKFKFVRKIEGTCSAYGHDGVKTGKVIDLKGPLADKAAGNPDFEAVKAVKKGK